MRAGGCPYAALWTAAVGQLRGLLGECPYGLLAVNGDQHGRSIWPSAGRNSWPLTPGAQHLSRADSLAYHDACAQLDPVILGRVVGIDALHPVAGWAGWWCR